MIQSCRLLEGQLQTPRLEFRNPQTESVVSLVGMIAFATPGYYEEIRDYIAEREKDGAAVHYELISHAKPDDADADQASAWLTAKLNSSHHFFRSSLEGVLRRGLGLIPRHEGLRYKSHWENYDVSDQELTRQLGRGAVLNKIVDNAVGGAMLQTIPSFLAHRAAVSMMKHVARGGTRILDGESREDEVIIHGRNQVALEAVDYLRQSDPTRDAVLLWGGGHLAGLGEGLLERNYDLIGEEWLLAAILEA